MEKRQAIWLYTTSYSLGTKLLKAAKLSWVSPENFDKFLVQWSGVTISKKKKILLKMWHHAITWTIWIDRDNRICREKMFF